MKLVRPRLPVSNRVLAWIVGIAAAATAFILGTAWLVISYSVDVRDLAGTESTVAEHPDARQAVRPALRFAVGAMITPARAKTYYHDLVRLVANRVGYRTKFEQRRTYAEVNALLQARKIDVAFVCSGPYSLGREQGYMELLAVPVVAGEVVYHSYIIARRESLIRSLEDLRGTRFVFTDPDSHTGRLVPTRVLADIGETPDSFFEDTFFSYSHDNSIWAVAQGLADGAAVDSLVWDFMDRVEPSITAKTRIIWTSPPFGIPPVVVQPAVDPQLKSSLQRAFVSLHEDEEGAQLLRQLHIDRFEPGDDSRYDSVGKVRRWFEAHQEGAP